MKQKRWHNHPTRVCFVRWSRNAAAVFQSLKLEVIIGRLKSNVQERIAPKANAWALQTEDGVMHLFRSDETNDLSVWSELRSDLYQSMGIQLLMTTEPLVNIASY